MADEAHPVDTSCERRLWEPITGYRVNRLSRLQFNDASRRGVTPGREANLVSIDPSRESNSEFTMMNPIMNAVPSFAQSREWDHSVHKGNVWSTRPNSLVRPYNSSV
jgi:hypothetical protein